MTSADRDDYKDQMKALKAANAATVLQCGCCQGTKTIAALVQGKEGAVAKALGFRKPRDDGDHDDQGFGGHGHGHHGKPGGWSQHEGMGIENTLEEKCQNFLEQDGCTDAVANAGGQIDCSWYDSMHVKRGRHHSVKLYCSCCRDPAEPVDPADLADPVDPADPADPTNPGGD